MEERRFQHVALAMVLLTAAGLFAIRLAAPPNLADNDQERPASYALDAALNGHWIVQRDWMGQVASKPPLYTWLAALATLAAGRANLFSLYLPAALSVTGMALVVLLAGRRLFSQPAGLLGAMMFLLSPMMSRQIALARTDALFGFLIALAALAAFERRWTLFWLLAALATLAKGPLGVVLAAGGLVAVGRARPPAAPRPGRRPSPTTAGIAIFLAITLGWFFLAWHVGGQAFIDRVLKRELIGHIVASDAGSPPFVDFYKPFPYFLHRFAPWSLLACVGFWRVAFGRAGPTDPPGRVQRPRPTNPTIGESDARFQRFLFAWFWVGMIIFSISPHQRADLMAPIIPPAALLAGRELAGWLKRVRAVRLILGTAAVAVVLLSYTAFRYFGMADRPAIQRTLGMKALAEKLGDAPVVHVDTPFTLQFYLNTMQTITPPDEAGRMLASTSPVIVAACDWGKVTERLPAGLTFVEVGRWPSSGEPFVRVFSNR